MAVFNAKTIEEYAVRKWLDDNQFCMECFDLSETEAGSWRLTDNTGNSMLLFYDRKERQVRYEFE